MREQEQLRNGDRIQLHPATDRWMMGDKYGEIIGLDRKYVQVKMDRSGDICTVKLDDVLERVS